jgi:D-amino peptidase
MKVYISVDLEGIHGIASRDELDSSSSKYERAVRLMEKEISFVVKELFKNGAKEILVNDSHNTMDNIRIENLPSNVELISGYIKPLSMMEGIQRGFDLALFIGYHASAGTAGAQFAHTYSSKIINKISINSRKASEAYINGLIASYFKVPVGIISGDKILYETEKDIFKRTEFVITKEGISFNSALLYPEEKIFEDYSNKIKKVLNNIPEPLTIPEKYKVEIQLKDIQMIDKVSILPFVKRGKENLIFFETEDTIEMFKMIRSIIMIAR